MRRPAVARATVLAVVAIALIACAAWARLQASPPPARFGAAMAYDPSHQVLYLFGGDRGDCCGGKTNELWAYDGSTWRRTSP